MGPTRFSDQILIEAVPPPVAGQPKIDDRGHFTNIELKDFPNFGGYEDGVMNVKTGYPLWDIFHVGDLSTRQMNMMNYYASWMVNEAWDGLHVNGVELFGGFKSIFENEKEDEEEEARDNEINVNDEKNIENDAAGGEEL